MVHVYKATELNAAHVVQYPDTLVRVRNHHSQELKLLIYMLVLKILMFEMNVQGEMGGETSMHGLLAWTL